MTRDDLISQSLITELDNCYLDSEYGQNTLNDILLYGFKGLNNMTDNELTEFLDKSLTWNKGL